MEEFSWEREGDGPTLRGEKPEQQQIVYITNLEDGLRKDDTTLYEEEVTNEKKPVARNRPIEVPSLNNPNHVLILTGSLIVTSSTLKIFRREKQERILKNTTTLIRIWRRKESKPTCKS